MTSLSDKKVEYPLGAFEILECYPSGDVKEFIKRIKKRSYKGSSWLIFHKIINEEAGEELCSGVEEWNLKIRCLM